ncbi:MAG: DUF5606 domain-containing protein [Bacteroidales bacterium]|nr:DUF5606 domain-containing protein [Bacteroidales bacterium]
MDLKEIMSVSGHSGLFRFVSQGRNGIIVESFADKKRMFVSASQKVSSLSDIAIFTDGDEVPLKDVFKSIHDAAPGVQAPDAKSSPDELRKFMEKALPNFDRERVYISDIKKLVTWYNTLLALNMISFEEEAAESTAPAENTENQVEEKPAEAKPEKVKKTEKPATPKAKKPAEAKKTASEKKK